MRFFALLAMVALAAAPFQLQGQAAQQAPEEPWPFPAIHDDPLLDPLTSKRLEPFSVTAAYREWLTSLQAYNTDRSRRVNEEMQRRQQRKKTGFLRIGYQEEELCVDPECLMPDGNEQIVVTGSVRGAPSHAAPARASKAKASSGPNITNVQTAGVDEGDVVKQIGEFLAVLQDGRIFVVDIRRSRLRLADRINVYTDKIDGAWYDEMLVEGNRIIVTAYSYGRQATEISVFKLDQETGKLAREGRFFISSYDYYSGENYASRIVGDELVLYTLYDARLILSEGGAPRLWRWTGDKERKGGARLPAETTQQGRSLIDAGSVYRPLLRTSNPMIHVITVCPLRSYDAGSVPACRVSAFAGPAAREFFVSPTDIYLWVGEPSWNYDYAARYDRARCTRSDVAHDAVAPAAVYRIPLNGGAPGAVGMRGQPIDQFSMDMTKDSFRILTRWSPTGCGYNQPQPVLAYANIPVGEFANRFRAIAPGRHVKVPAPQGGVIENRFADDWLAYGGRLSGYGAVPDRPQPGNPLFVLPVDRPRAVQRLALPHNIIRIERVGAERMAVSGYKDTRGLDLSLLQLGGRASVLDTARLDDRFESEGRSHAFNSLVEDDGSGILGLPTVARRGRAMRYVWNSEGSDVSFLRMAPSGRLSDAGALEQGGKRPAPGYSCEVSCIDWYGNSRPIFTNGRIFALMATEIAEGRMTDKRIVEIDRLNLTQKRGWRSALAD